MHNRVGRSVRTQVRLKYNKGSNGEKEVLMNNTVRLEYMWVCHSIRRRMGNDCSLLIHNRVGCKCVRRSVISERSIRVGIFYRRAGMHNTLDFNVSESVCGVTETKNKKKTKARSGRVAIEVSTYVGDLILNRRESVF